MDLHCLPVDMVWLSATCMSKESRFKLQPLICVTQRISIYITEDLAKINVIKSPDNENKSKNTFFNYPSGSSSEHVLLWRQTPLSGSQLKCHVNTILLITLKTSQSKDIKSCDERLIQLHQWFLSSRFTRKGFNANHRIISPVVIN